MKANYMVIGYGWRADFYYRIAKLLPEQFSICAGVLRTEARAKEVTSKEHIFTTVDLDEALSQKPDFAVLCVPREIAKDYLVQLMEKGIPVLCETPPGKNVAELNELWTLSQKYNGRVQIVEQYFLQPYYASILDIIKQGYLGTTSSVMLSALHGYHAVSIFRKFLGIKYENCIIQGKKFWSEVTATNGRNGFDESGTIIQEDRDWAFMQFENGKNAFLDFEGEQYFSQIRTRRWNVRGVRGEINDNTVRFLNASNQPIEQSLQRVDVGINNNSEWAHKGILFLDKQVYQNPFYPARMNDDEIAVASCLACMKNFTENGTEFYSLREALQDTYLSFMLEQAIESEKTVKTETQPWGF